MQCEMCGKTVTSVKTITTEGTELQVCDACSKFGKIKKIPRTIDNIQEVKDTIKQANYQKKQYKNYYKSVDIDAEINLVQDYKEKIKNKRENLNLKQEDLAKKLNIKENIVHRIETGHLEPNINLIKKLESFLNIKLIDNSEKEKISLSHEKTEATTIGNSIQIKVRKKK